MKRRKFLLGLTAALSSILIIKAGIEGKKKIDSTLAQKSKRYLDYVQECIDNLIEYGIDHYGNIHTPVLVSILDLETLSCPENPAELDEYYRVNRRERRNPAGANMLADQPLFKTMRFLSAITANDKYDQFAHKYMDYYMKNLIDEKGLFWWGWHRYYDVYTDSLVGHGGDHHEIHAIHCIDWERLWDVNSEAVQNEIEAIWEWHVSNKETGEINRHSTGKGGSDFSMSAGAYIEAFAFLYHETQDKKWLKRAILLADYYWARRNPETNLFPDQPKAGNKRFDGNTFVTSITGLYCHSLLKAYELTTAEKFKDYAVAHLKAYAKYGFDEDTGKFWGALELDGTPVPGPRVYADDVNSKEGYIASQPRGHLDLWEPYIAGYQYAIYTAQAYAYAYQMTGDEILLTTAERFAAWIQKTPPSTIETENTWYKEYSRNQGQLGTYAGKYGRVISFYIYMYINTQEDRYLAQAREMADEAIKKLYYQGLFRGHPAKSYYEAIDGVGYLLYALLELDQVERKPAEVLSQQAIFIDDGNKKTTIALDNW